MHLVQLFLPRTDNAGAALPKALFGSVRSLLLERFGGVTAYIRAPAQGIWVDDGAHAVVDDDLVVYEVVVEHLDRDWWQRYRRNLERDFRQERLHVRAVAMQLL